MKNVFVKIITFPFKAIKEIFSDPIGVLVGIVILFIILFSFVYKAPKCYVGKVISISDWDGSAQLKTTSKAGKDTILIVYPRNHEMFCTGQTITVWTGGDIMTDVATTRPQGE